LDADSFSERHFTEIGALLLCPDVYRLFQLLQNSFRLGKGFRAMTDAIFFRVTQFCQCLSELGDKEDRNVPKSRRPDSLLGDQTIQHTFHGLDLIDRGFYDGLKFHRYEPGFVIQGGDPKGNGTGGFVDPATGKERRIPLEVTPELKHGEAGALAMARSSDPNSASCQFYITIGPAAFLDMNYAVFGRVLSGIDVVKQLRAGDSMTSVKIET